MSQRFTIFLLLTPLAGFGCTGSMGGPDLGNSPRFGEPEDDLGEVPTPACPQDPDCGFGGESEDCRECPDYWLCDDLATGIKRCTNPGPDYPDGGDWDCEDRAGTTVCRGDSFPDGGGDGDWNCERQGEFVVCENDNPDYPDSGGDGPWNCWFEGEFRICESSPPDHPGGGGWHCFDTPDGGRECRNNDPDYPDDREWDCYLLDGELWCRTPGDDVPDDGGGGEWDCESRGEFVICNDDEPDYPDGGGPGEWDCDYGQEFVICTEPPEDGPGEPGGPGTPGGPGEPGGPGTPGGPGGPGDGECVPGVQRWCDDAIYCSWGKQTCLPDGSWGRCIEPTVTSDGLQDRPDTACGCRYFYFNYDCCEDQADRDGDGLADCIIPEDHAPPACPSDGSPCSYCDNHDDCGSRDDVCVFRRDGYAFCGQDCSASSCPSGYSCQTLNTRSGPIQQCVPPSSSCE